MLLFGLKVENGAGPEADRRKIDIREARRKNEIYGWKLGWRDTVTFP